MDNTFRRHNKSTNKYRIDHHQVNDLPKKKNWGGGGGGGGFLENTKRTNLYKHTRSPQFRMGLDQK